MRKRLVSMLLLVAMVISMFPTTAFAATANYSVEMDTDSITTRVGLTKTVTASVKKDGVLLTEEPAVSINMEFSEDEQYQMPFIATSAVTSTGECEISFVALKAGTGTITVTYTDEEGNDYSASTEVTVGEAVHIEMGSTTDIDLGDYDASGETVTGGDEDVLTYSQSGDTVTLNPVTSGFTTLVAGSETIPVYVDSFHTVWHWYPGKGTVELYESGETPTTSEVPTRPNDGVYAYEFRAWDSGATVEGEPHMVFNAEYDQYRLYGISLSVEELDMKVGDTATVTLDTHPASLEGDDEIVWIVDDEDVATVEPSADGYSATITAIGPGEASVTVKVGSYSAATLPVDVSTHQYTITWDVDGVQTTETYDLGATPAYDGSLLKSGYKFVGWEPAISEVSGDQTYTAQFKPTYNVYWVVGLATTQETYAEGETPVYKGATPEKNGYTFTGWDPAVVVVTGEATYTAQFELIPGQEPNEYVITPSVDDIEAAANDEPITVTVELSPELVSGDEIEWTSNNDNVVTVEGNGDTAIITPVGEGETSIIVTVGGSEIEIPVAITAAQYTITWDVGGTQTTETYSAGEMPTFKGSTDRESDENYIYTFSRWNPAISAVTGDATYVAMYNTQSRRGIHFDSLDDIYLQVDATKQVAYTLYPEDMDVTWSSDAESVATVDQNGLITAIGSGSANITCASDDGQYTATVEVHVSNASQVTYTITWIVNGTSYPESYAPNATPTYKGDTTRPGYNFVGWSPAIQTVTGTQVYVAQYEPIYTINANVSALGLDIGDVETIRITVEPEVATGDDIIWTSSDDEVVEVVAAADGMSATVTALDEGEAQVRVQVGANYMVIPVEVAGEGSGPANPNTYTITPSVSAVELNEGDEPATVTVTLSPALASGDTIEWSIDDEDVATVDGNGASATITPVGEGEASITVTVGGSEIEIPVSVSAGEGSEPVNPNTYTITPSVSSVSMSEDDDAETISVTLSPALVSGDAIEWSVGDEDVAIVEGDGASATITPVGVGTTTITVKVGGSELVIPVVINAAEPEPNTYTITWFVNGQATQESYSEGAIPTFKGSTANAGYTFTGWSPAITAVSKNQVYTAQYEEIVTYDITWVVNGTITKETYNAGATPTFKGSTDRTGYTFTGWNPAITTVSGNTVYTAQYTQNTSGEVVTPGTSTDTEVKTYTVTWIVNGNPTTETYAENSVPVFKGETGITGYTFTGWNPAVTAVTGDVTYVAQYTANSSDAQTYLITWVVDGKTYSTFCAAGATPIFAGDTTKTGDAQYDFVFKGWNTPVVPCVGPATYVAQYEKVDHMYTVKWDVDGKVTTQTYKYGATPVYSGTPSKADTDQYSYTFLGWTPAIVAVEKDVTYIAQFKQTVKEYTITWKDYDGSTLKTEKVAYGKTPSYGTHDPIRKSENGVPFEFTGWTPTVVTVTGDATYTANYEKGTGKETFTVIWKDWDGTVLEKQTKVAPGADLVYHGEEPSRPVKDNVRYVFIGWDPDMEDMDTVETNLTFIAQYESSDARELCYTEDYLDDLMDDIDSFETKVHEFTDGELYVTAEAIEAMDEYDGDFIIRITNDEKAKTVTIEFILVDKDGEETIITDAIPGLTFLAKKLTDEDGDVVLLSAGTSKKDKDFDMVMFSLVTEDGSYSAIPGTCTIKLGSDERYFLDVSGDSWCIDEVNFVSSRNIMIGTAYNMFTPNGSVTRAQALTIAYRLAGEPSFSGGVAYDDFSLNVWYTQPAYWATTQKLLPAVNEAKDYYGIGEAITREDLALMLYNLARYLGFDCEESVNLGRYLDAGMLTDSERANAMEWAVAVGIIEGRTSTTLAPQGVTTRAEMGAMLARFISHIVVPDVNLEG